MMIPAFRAARRKALTEDFLEVFSRTGNITTACEELAPKYGTSAAALRTMVMEYREILDGFAERFDFANDMSADRLEAEALRRAVDGVEETVYQAGTPVGTTRKYSDSLLMFLLKARRPAVYRERVEHSGPGGGPMEFRSIMELVQAAAAEPTTVVEISK